MQTSYEELLEIGSFVDNMVIHRQLIKHFGEGPTIETYRYKDKFCYVDRRCGMRRHYDTEKELRESIQQTMSKSKIYWSELGVYSVGLDFGSTNL